jgi:hypothetical protein
MRRNVGTMSMSCASDINRAAGSEPGFVNVAYVA